MKKIYQLIALILVFCSLSFGAHAQQQKFKTTSPAPKDYVAPPPQQDSRSTPATSVSDLIGAMNDTQKIEAYNAAFAYIHGVIESTLLFEMTGKSAGQKAPERLCGLIGKDWKVSKDINEIAKAVIKKFDKSNIPGNEVLMMGAAQFIVSNMDKEFGCSK